MKDLKQNPDEKESLKASDMIYNLYCSQQENFTFIKNDYDYDYS